MDLLPRHPRRVERLERAVPVPVLDPVLLHQARDRHAHGHGAVLRVHVHHQLVVLPAHGHHRLPGVLLVRARDLRRDQGGLKANFKRGGVPRT